MELHIRYQLDQSQTVVDRFVQLTPLTRPKHMPWMDSQRFVYRSVTTLVTDFSICYQNVTAQFQFLYCIIDGYLKHYNTFYPIVTTSITVNVSNRLPQNECKQICKYKIEYYRHFCNLLEIYQNQINVDKH